MLYEFTELQLDKKEFDNLVFMNAPPWWKHEYHRNRSGRDRDLTAEQVFLLDLCCKPLKEVVKKVKEKADLQEQEVNSTAIFEKLLGIKAKHKRGSEESEPWFKSYAELSQCFDKDLMPPIWIRNLSVYENGEKYKCPDGTFYIEDGNHRALIYALKVDLEKVEYTPFPAIHATSWGVAAEILEHLPQKADVLEHKGVLPYKKHFKDGVRLPIGIRADTYERCRDVESSTAEVLKGV